MIVYICSPFKGDVQRNKNYARALTKKALLCGYTPITPHLYLTEVTNDSLPEERALGLQAGLLLLSLCDEIWVGEDYGISDGMRGELKEAQAKNMKITRILLNC